MEKVKCPKCGDMGKFESKNDIKFTLCPICREDTDLVFLSKQIKSFRENHGMDKR